VDEFSARIFKVGDLVRIRLDSRGRLPSALRHIPRLGSGFWKIMKITAGDPFPPGDFDEALLVRVNAFGMDAGDETVVLYLSDLEPAEE
jgi:hypothetical protein